MKRPEQARPGVLITAGPTQEPLDAVRFLSNRSTGRMGMELAREARRRGWPVTLILGPVAEMPPSGVKVVRVRTAREMDAAVRRRASRFPVLIMAAAVGDWRPVRVRSGKWKRGKVRRTSVALVQNPDILQRLPARGRPFVRVGFCLESGHLRREALRKLRAKRLDWIVANRIQGKKRPFGAGRTSVRMFDRRGGERALRDVSKRRVARVLMDLISGAMAE